MNEKIVEIQKTEIAVGRIFFRVFLYCFIGACVSLLMVAFTASPSDDILVVLQSAVSEAVFWLLAGLVGFVLAGAFLLLRVR